MSIIKTLKTASGMEDVFPHPVTNAFINSMERKMLTPGQKILPYAHYYETVMALTLVWQGTVQLLLASAKKSHTFLHT